MQLPGPGVFGPPKDRDVALRVVRRVRDTGVNHIDTAQFYGPGVANELLREAPRVLVIPGTSLLEHLEENPGAADLVLDQRHLTCSRKRTRQTID
jgi:aryl-alcohol dehydrogenase-like predicted oxidoreductase